MRKFIVGAALNSPIKAEAGRQERMKREGVKACRNSCVRCSAVSVVRGHCNSRGPAPTAAEGHSRWDRGTHIRLGPGCVAYKFRINFCF